MPRLMRAIEEKDLDFIIIALGLSDANLHEDPEEMYYAFAEAVEYSQNAGVPVVIGVIDIQGLGWGDCAYSSQFQSIFSRLKKSHPQIVLFEFLNLRMTIDPFYFSFADERSIPNAKGHLLIAQNLKAALMNSTIHFVEKND
jgi:hypothetical protein